MGIFEPSKVIYSREKTINLKADLESQRQTFRDACTEISRSCSLPLTVNGIEFVWGEGRSIDQLPSYFNAEPDIGRITMKYGSGETLTRLQKLCEKERISVKLTEEHIPGDTERYNADQIGSMPSIKYYLTATINNTEELKKFGKAYREIMGSFHQRSL